MIYFHIFRNIELKRKGIFMNLNNLQEAVEFFIVGFLELSVLFLGISFFVEILNTKINPEKIQKVLSSKKSGYLTASLLGSITPFCSCSTIPLTIGLIRAKAGFGPIMTFLFTSPLLNPIVVIVFYITFGLKITLIYSLTALLASLAAGFTLEKLGFEKYIKLDENENETASTSKFAVNKDDCCDSSVAPTTLKFTTISSNDCCDGSKKENKKDIYKGLFKKTWKQFVSFLPYIAIGIGIGAFVHGFVPEEFITKYANKDNLLAIPISALAGIPLYIRASTMVGLGPELIANGVSMGAILALTIAGAGASLPEMIMLKKIFKMPIMIFFLVSVFIMAIGCGYIVNLYFS